ncbi:MAG: HAD-IA family hydrolase [Spirochaetota bacterium]
MQKSHILFDFDGTLFETRKDIIHAVNSARKKHGYATLADAVVLSYVGNGIADLAKKSFADTDVSMEEAKESVVQSYRENPSTYSFPYEGVFETLAKLQTKKLFIVSNKPEALVLHILHKHYPEHRFLEVFGGDSLPNRKPHPEAVEFIQNKYKCQKEEMVMVGDLTPDILLAKNAGIDSIFCQYGFSGTDEVGATWQIASFVEILEYV